MGYVLLALGAVLLVLALHPFLTYPLSLKLIARLFPKPLGAMAGSTGRPPSVAFCVCAYNEEQIIEAKIENMLLAARTLPQVEVLVYVDQSSDQTAQIVSRYDRQIRCFFPSSRTGKTQGMNRLVSSTTADIIVFTDANVLYAPDALNNLLKPFAHPSVGCVLGNLKYVSPTVSATADTGSFYWRLEEKIKELECLSGSAMTADGAIFAIRRELHVSPPANCADDIFISLSILCAGYRVMRVADAVAYEDIGADAAQEFQRKIRIACIAYNSHRLLWPQLRALPWVELYKYMSHKVLRWLSIFAFAASGVAILLAVGLLWGWIAAGALAGFGSLALAAVLIVRRGPFAVVGSVLQALFATGVGVALSYTGRQFQTWTTPSRASFDLPATTSDRSVR